MLPIKCNTICSCICAPGWSCCSQCWRSLAYVMALQARVHDWYACKATLASPSWYRCNKTFSSAQHLLQANRLSVQFLMYSWAQRYNRTKITVSGSAGLTLGRCRSQSGSLGKSARLTKLARKDPARYCSWPRRFRDNTVLTRFCLQQRGRLSTPQFAPETALLHGIDLPSLG